ncbi:MAG: hypothetical protein Q4E74_09740 [Ruminococcus sp.]|nr:hypothetical protein [Ruminococcus sp.]
MIKYKLIGTKEGETPEQAIIRCANNLIKAVIAAGYSIHNTSEISGVEVKFYRDYEKEIMVNNVLSHWQLTGKATIKPTFRPSNNELELDEETPNGDQN